MLVLSGHFISTNGVWLPYYCRHTRYGEGNVFTCVCLFTGGLHFHNAMGRRQTDPPTSVGRPPRRQTPIKADPKKADCTRIQILIQDTANKRAAHLLLVTVPVNGWRLPRRCSLHPPWASPISPNNQCMLFWLRGRCPCRIRHHCPQQTSHSCATWWR